MSELILNVSFAVGGPPRRPPAGNRRHRSFVRRRRLLERLGALKEKQLPPNARRQPKGDAKKPGAGASGPLLKASGAPPAPCKLVAIDCEMVGTGPGGRTSALARCSIVGYEGDVLYDQYVRPAEPVVDYRTRWSGVRRHHLANAVPFGKAQREILRLLSGKVVVGHAVHNDFKALRYCHPKALTRDTSKIPLLNRRGGFPEGVSVSLKRLAKELLHRDIQVRRAGPPRAGRNAD
ncbi:interferon-stimulated 20 kDa exonuclease-like 2 [Cygnus atratus]|uniref:interferon-stimulated 20 kDa exonuclease-like 2 n=1 Tax=Cygnus atratus TaxID=8868 RepID=UPI0021B78BFA|nr:interferon-stimulated 20 kDa exonuclease-like 2 [Cygnus atratus]